jgi:signal transduction histidine kinase
MLGHDLRDPLHTITFAMQFVLDEFADDVPPAALRSTVRAATTAHRMERMIRDLLDFAHGRLGSGLPVVPVAIDARPLVQDAVQELADANPTRTMICAAGTAIGDFGVTWDGDRIVQALSNLVGNAIAHGSDPVVIELLDHGDQIEITVTNRGEIPRERMPKLFDPFAHAGGERRDDEHAYGGPERRRGHLGLGLFIVSQIAKAHEGRVVAESADGHTAFRLTLPRTGPAAHHHVGGAPAFAG